MSKDLFYQQLLAQEKELLDTLDAIRKLKKHYTIVDVPQQNIPFKEPEHNIVASIKNDGYDKAWIVKDKVLFSLKQLGKGTADEVADVLIKIDGDFEESKANRACTTHLSALYRDNVIGASKVGKKYRYYIKNDEPIKVSI